VDTLSDKQSANPDDFLKRHALVSLRTEAADPLMIDDGLPGLDWRQVSSVTFVAGLLTGDCLCR
jgi:hypothetical protein